MVLFCGAIAAIFMISLVVIGVLALREPGAKGGTMAAPLGERVSGPGSLSL